MECEGSVGGMVRKACERFGCLMKFTGVGRSRMKGRGIFILFYFSYFHLFCSFVGSPYPLRCTCLVEGTRGKVGQ